MNSFDSVVCFAPGHYHQFTPSCTTHTMHAMLTLGHRVLWVNPAPIGIPGLRRRGDWNRILRRCRSLLAPLKRGPAGLIAFSPLGPRRIRSRQIRVLSRALQFRRSLTWIENADSPEAIGLFDGPSIYQLSDKYELSRYASPGTRARLAGNSRRLMAHADLVICTSRTLWNEVVSVREDAIYLPHAVSNDFIDVPPGPAPADIAAIPRPRLGYFGTLSSSNDLASLQACARAHPEWHIVLIGRVTGGDFSLLEKHRNVHFLGFKPMREIPRYGREFDVALMNWKLDAWMHYVHPLKLREYLALGLAVVSVPIPEVVSEYAGLVYIGRTPDEFVTAVETALEQDCEERRSRRIRSVADFTWERRLDLVLSALHPSGAAARPRSGEEAPAAHSALISPSATIAAR